MNCTEKQLMIEFLFYNILTDSNNVLPCLAFKTSTKTVQHQSFQNFGSWTQLHF